MRRGSAAPSPPASAGTPPLSPNSSTGMLHGLGSIPSGSLVNIRKASSTTSLNFTDPASGPATPEMQALKRQSTHAIKQSLEQERKEFAAVSKEYESLYDPPDNLERKMVELQKRIRLLEQQLAVRQQLYDQRGCSESRELRYLPQGMGYKFTEPDSEENIIFEDEDAQVVQPIPTLRAATLTKLVERVTFDEYADPTFLLQFLLTYKSFCSPEQLLELLMERFSMPLPPPTSAETEKFKTTILNPVRLRVMNVFKNWLDKHFADFQRRPQLLETLKDFLQTTVASSPGMDKQLEVLQRMIAKKESAEKEDKHIHFSTPPDAILPTDGIQDTELMQFDSLEIARQLTLMEYDLYRSISPTDLSQLACGDVMEDSFTALSNRFNEVSNWIVTMLVTTRSPQMRVDLLVKFVQIANCCHQLNNFNAVFEIVSALLSTPIHRLKKTWAAVPEDVKLLFDQLSKGVARADNFKQYRANLLSVNPPCIPYLGVYLTDLTFIRDANPNKLPDSDLINFSKRRRISEVLMSLQQYQQSRYNFWHVDPIQQLLLDLPSLSVDECYRESLKIEPRENALKNQEKKIGFVLNTTARSGKAEKLWEKLVPRVEEYFANRWSVVTTKHPGHGEQLTRELIKSGHSIIVAVGGDGTVKEVINGYMKSSGLVSEIVLGILPLGNNDTFAKTVGLATADVTDALRVIYEGYTTQCDVGSAVVTNDMGKPANAYFLNCTTIGLLSELLRLENKNNKSKASKEAWKNYLTQSISYSIDGEHWLSTNNLCIMSIGNAKSVCTGVELCPEADISDGLLDITIIDADEEPDAAKIMTNLRKGKLLQNDQCRMGQSKDIEVRNVYPGDKISVAMDGEEVGYLPVTFKVVEGGAALIVPSSLGYSKPAVSTLKRSDSSSSHRGPAASASGTAAPDSPASGRRNSTLPPVPETLVRKKGGGFFFKEKTMDISRNGTLSGSSSPNGTLSRRTPSVSMLDSLFKRNRGRSVDAGPSSPLPEESSRASLTSTSSAPTSFA